MLAMSRPKTREPHLALVVGHPGRAFGMEKFARFLSETAFSGGWRITVALSGEDIYTGSVCNDRNRLTVAQIDWIDKTLKGDREYDWRTILARRRWFRKIRPDVAVFVHSSNTPFRASVVGAWLAGVPVITTHRTMAWPVEQTVSKRHVFGLIPGMGLHRRRLIRKTWLTSALASRIVYNSRAVREGYEQLYHYPHRKGRVIVNAVSKMATYPCPCHDDSNAHEITIGYVGRIGRDKRLDILFRAVAGLQTKRPVRIIIYGDGAERAPLTELATKLGITDHIEWCGQTSDVASAHNRFDIVVLCSPRESSSNMVLEAMSAGKAVVVTDVGGLPELIGHGRYGTCVPPLDVPALTAALDRLIADDAERTRLGVQARAVACARHDPQTVSQAWMDLLSEVASGQFTPQPGPESWPTQAVEHSVA